MAFRLSPSTDLAAAVRSRTVSAREVVQAHLDRIAAVNPAVNAVTAVLADDALGAADQADRKLAAGDPVGPLHGRAQDLVTRALLLAPEFAEAHAVRAWLAQYRGEWSRADFGYFAATSMDPNDVTTRVWS